MPNNEIISFHFSNNESKMKDKNYIQNEFLHPWKFKMGQN